MRYLIIVLGLFNCMIAWTQNYPVNAKLQDNESFSMVLIPDPQSYVKFAANQPLFDLQTAWVANNIKELNIKAVLCTGDLVEQNEIRVADGINGDQTSEEQWKAVAASFSRLDGKVSYILCTGNHDYGYKSSEIRKTNFHRYFPSEKNSCWKKSLVSVGLNSDGIPTLENAAYEFKLPFLGDMLILSLEFAPRDEAIEWAKSVIGDKKYINHRVILITHSFLDYKGERFLHEDYRMSSVNYAEAVWKKLVYPSSNIYMVICGHECYITGYDKQVSYRSDLNKYGKTVHQMMFNAQTADGQWYGNGGDCWLRILEFKPDGKTISVRTFSPLFALSPLTKDNAWRTESYDQFSIMFD